VVGDRHDGSFMPASDEQRLGLRLEHALGATCSMSELAQQTANVKIVLAPAPVSPASALRPRPFSSRHVPHVPCIDHLRAHAQRLQHRRRTFPVNVGASHHHFIRVQRLGPFGQVPAVSFESAKLSLLHTRGANGLLNQCTGRNLRLMNVQTNHALIQCPQPDPSHLLSIQTEKRKVAGAGTEGA